MHCSSDIHSGREGQIIKYKYPVKGAYTAASACPCILTPVITGLWAIVAINVSQRDDLPQFFRSRFFFFLLTFLPWKKRGWVGECLCGGARQAEGTRGEAPGAFRLSTAGIRVTMPRRLFLFTASPNYTWQAAGKFPDWCTKLSSTCN